ncbi:TetR/AcrR family transcriptional regulator [Mycolicibacterium sp. P1-18]|uniref:TetR/AcrR family transcriptional regulator n=1 Tax=Mycolicibacterium sp. P1-18 TaxID=2024615 RepID=UPI0011F22951|nr:TetR/AcrR family transcriptional regulator [Mycolicibacterium sp. P1-18]KAA0097634.1 TetR/AcrR family transcriptional regulator [Mycolicibacterium sp. P1-18]
MGRWPEGARTRLEAAASALFIEQGFAETTVPQIAARAGLTTRTFFRHFADKREVLFAYQAELPDVVRQAMAAAPQSAGALEVIAVGLQTIATTKFDGRRDYLLAHQAVIDSDPGLRERGLRKMSILTEAIGRGFRERGLDDLAATLAAHTAVTVLSVALDRWFGAADETSLSVHVADALAAWKSLATPDAEPG